MDLCLKILEKWKSTTKRKPTCDELLSVLRSDDFKQNRLADNIEQAMQQSRKHPAAGEQGKTIILIEGYA